MSIELRIASGARGGERERFEKSVITVGRHPRNDLRFDAERDLDVSAYHAELRGLGERWVLRDLQSTNGTWVNGERLASGTERELKDRDTVTFGERGPRVEIRIVRPGEPTTAPIPAAAPRRRTTERVAAEVHRQTAVLRWTAVALGVLLVAGVGSAWWMGQQREASRRDAAIEALLARNAALGAQYRQDIAQLSGRLGGLDSALQAAKRESDSLRLLIERDARSGTDLSALASRQQVAERRRASLLRAASLDYSAIAAANAPAVAMIAVEMQDGRTYAGTGFNVGADGRVVTNRHLVVDESGGQPRRIAVIFADTHVWLPARLERLSDTTDLALVSVEAAGTYPVVHGIAPGDAPVPVGAPVAIIGYPLGTGTPMEGSGTAIIARTSLGAGLVSKSLADVMQIDAYAGPGSSGSPVFDGEGRVAGVVFGGAAASAGRIVLALPARALETFLR